MSKYFIEAIERLDKVSYPFEVHDVVFGRLMGYIGYIRMNIKEEKEDTVSYLDELVVSLLSIMQDNTNSVRNKIDLYHQLAHALADKQIMLYNGEMPTDNLWYPGCVTLL